MPNRILTAEKLINAIAYCLTAHAQESAQEIMMKMQYEVGVEAAVESFHRNLPTDLACDMLPSETALWKVKRGRRWVKLSAKATAASC